MCHDGQLLWMIFQDYYLVLFNFSLFLNIQMYEFIEFSEQLHRIILITGFLFS